MAVDALSFDLVAVAAPGMGYIAGESPDGLVTLDGVPGRAVVDLLVRATHAWERRTISADNGSYRFSGLPVATVYDVIGQDPSNTFGDVIVSRVSPYYPPEITTASLAFTAGQPVSLQLLVQYGAGPFVWSVDVLPAGLSLSADGLITGTPAAAGSTEVVVSVIDAHGAEASRAYTVVVA